MANIGSRARKLTAAADASDAAVARMLAANKKLARNMHFDIQKQADVLPSPATLNNDDDGGWTSCWVSQLPPWPTR